MEFYVNTAVRLTTYKLTFSIFGNYEKNCKYYIRIIYNSKLLSLYFTRFSNL